MSFEGPFRPKLFYDSMIFMLQGCGQDVFGDKGISQLL